MIRELRSMFSPNYPAVLVYMLQSVEYQTRPYFSWLRRTRDFNQVMQRRTLDRTRRAGLLLRALQAGIILHILIGIGLICLGIKGTLAGGVLFGIAFILAYPLLWPYLLVVPLLLGRWFVSNPADQQRIAAAERIFAKHPGVKIAVAGSYGKTTMKEILLTVLGESLTVAATPANKNVSVSHANFAKKLTGKEDVLIIEYGEGAPGDVLRFAKLTHPTHAVITGVSPAHLDRYKTLEAAAEDIFTLAQRVPPGKVYVNGESPEVQPYIKSGYRVFSGHETLGWKISQAKTGFDGTSFVIKKGPEALKLHSGLVGKHQVGFLAFAAILGLELGLTHQQVQAGVAKTMPFEHRMQPYRLAGGWVIDDTYNGNKEGIRAGTHLFAELHGKRKIYVTPGLVDQGEETERVHVEAGRLIADAAPDIVVLMRNSATDHIKRGLEEGKFAGEVRIEPQPLEFYTNLNHFLAAGDLIVMQNDWTDNYA